MKKRDCAEMGGANLQSVTDDDDWMTCHLDFCGEETGRLQVSPLQILTIIELEGAELITLCK